MTRRDRLRNKKVRREHCGCSGEIKDEVVWACGEKDCSVMGKRNRGRQPRR